MTHILNLVGLTHSELYDLQLLLDVDWKVFLLAKLGPTVE